MIVPDVNVIVHAYNAESPVHDRAREWWEETMGAAEPVGLAWSVVLGYIRITTHTRILGRRCWFMRLRHASPEKVGNARFPWRSFSYWKNQSKNQKIR